MAELARATVGVDLDGKRLTEEARALGEEAGEAAGEGYNREFKDRTDEGLSDFGNTLNKVLREEATKDARGAGSSVGSSFSDELENTLRGRASETSRILANALANEDGFARFRENLQGAADHFVTIDEAADELGTHLERALGDGSITHDQFVEYGAHIRAAALEAEHLGPDLERLAADAARVSGGLDVDKLERWVADVGRAPGNVSALKGELIPLLDNLRGLRQGFEDGSVDADTFGRAFYNAAPKTQILGKALGVSEAGLRDIVRGSEDAGQALEGFGDEVLVADKKTGGLSKSLKQLAGSFSNFDPSDNPGQLFLVLLGLAGPLAPLISALGAQILILGTAAAGAAVGVGGLVAGFIGLSGKFGPLNASATAAAASFKALLDPLKQLGATLTNAEFKGLAKPFDELGAAIPKLGPGVTAIGTALNGFLKTLTSAIVNNIGAINGILKGFAPIVTNLGKVFVSLGGILGGIFKAATPFADAFTASLAKTLSKFSDFLNSTKGQNSLTKFFADAQPVMAEVLDVFGKVGGAFDAINTKANASNLKSVLAGVGDAVAALLKVGGSLGGTVGAVGKLLSLLSPIVSALAPVGEGISAVISGVVKLISPVVNFITSILTPVFATIGKIFDTLGAAFTAFTPVFTGYFSEASSIITPVVKAVTSLADAFEDFVQQGLKIASPAIKAFGSVLSTAGKAIGDLIGGLLGAGTQTNAFKDGAKAAGDFLNGPFKSAVTGVTGFFNGLAAKIRDTLIPAIKEIDWTKVIGGINQITSAIPAVIDAIGTIATAFGANIAADAAWAKLLIQSAADVVSSFGAIGKVVADVLSGNFTAAAADSVTAATKVKGAVGDLQTNVTDAMTKSKAAIDATNTAQDHLATDAATINTKIKAAFKDFSEAGDGNLATLSGKLGVTGDASAAFRAAVVANAKDSGTSLKTLADAKSLPDLETKLGLAGSASKTKFADEIISAMNQSGVSIDQVPPKIAALIKKYGDIPLTVKTKVTVDGTETAISRANAVGAALSALHDKTINVTQITKNIAQGTAAAVGGIMAGGQLIAGGRHAFSLGGIVSSPYSFGNILTGESGAEAIVPLSRPLSQVDPSVRNLAAFAQGLDATTNKSKSGSYVASGAIQIITPASDPAVVASQVIDRLVPIL